MSGRRGGAGGGKRRLPRYGKGCCFVYAIINLGEGRFYTSLVFASYCDECQEDNYWWVRYYIVLNEEKTALVKQYAFDVRHKPQLHKVVLITDPDQGDWRLDQKSGCGEIAATTKPELLALVEKGTVTDELIKMDAAYHFDAFQEIRQEKDIKALMSVSGSFRDAWIEACRETDEGVYVLFAGVWGCKIEMWFSGDVQYDVRWIDVVHGYPLWSSATMILAEGYIYFTNREGVSVEEMRRLEDLDEDCCQFIAAHVRYHVIPE